MTLSRVRAFALVVAVALVAAPPATAQSPNSAPAGQLTWASHVALAPTWFDPAETPGIITPFMIP
jgi:peptide/nickel transport system substrate-binding protein